MEDKKNLIETVLKGEEIAFEPVPEEQESPLAHPVVDRNQPVSESNATENETNNPGETNTQQAKPKEKPTDAPEQKIDDEPPEDTKSGGESDREEFSIPIETAGMLADSIIGTVNNTLLEVGGGYFVTIRKHKDFYDFEEVIQVIDEQNVKNIKRLKLDEEDKALIRPLLIHILRKKSAALSPEMQLLMVTLSILIKKTKAVIEIRAENEILVERIRDIIRKEMAAYYNHDKEEPEFNAHQSKQDTEEAYEDTDEFSASGNNTGLPDEAVEILD
jgi:hypothetical protein